MPLLNYKQISTEKSGTNKNILLIHGLLGSLDNLNMVANGLKETHCVTNVDVRNHGQSFHEKEMSYQALAQDIVDTLDHLNIKSTTVLGHSMGGKIAMQLALSNPNRVDKLIVADISPVQYPPHHNEIFKGLLSLDPKNIVDRKQADNELEHYVKEPSVRQFLLRNFTKKNGSFIFKCNLVNIWNCYPQIMTAIESELPFNKPVLFIKGGNSEYINSDHQKIIQKLFPHSKAKIIQGAGHWLHAEKTIAFNRIVNNFLVK